MRIQLVTGPINHAVSEREAKVHLRIPEGETADDEYIERLILVAAGEIEHMTGRAILDKTYDYWLDGWPDGDFIELPYPPLIWTVADSHIQYIHTPVETAGVVTYTTTTMSVNDYSVDRDSEPGRIALEYSKTWPSETLRKYNPINIRFDCGYDEPADVPEKLKQAMLLMIADMFIFRQTKIAAVKVETMDTVWQLIDDYCVDWL